MNILTIGNSFSQDGVKYLYQIAKNQEVDITVIGLVIGGCSLEMHHRNILGNFACYDMEINGDWTGFKMSIKDVLLNRHWDVITIQQVSSLSPKYESYQPYLNVCVDYIREFCPKAKVYLQQVWSYENGSVPLLEWTKYKNTNEMFADTKASYDKALSDCKADGLIPSGEVMLELMNGGFKVHRDGFHASLGFGRFALGLTWFATLTGKSIDGVTFTDFDEPVSDEQIKAAKAAVNKVLCL